ELKADAYERIFTENGVPKVFDYKTYEVEVRLKFYAVPKQEDEKDRSYRQVGEKYEVYWVDKTQLFDDV
ncbi:MAG: hypothetical protein ACP5H3_03630, partial [Candidatus Aenigmatarchaeota archaeon]